MKRFVLILLGLAWGWGLSTGLAQGDLPPAVREAAIADLNERISGLGRPSSWTYQITVADNANLGCPTVPDGQALPPNTRVYIIDLSYPNGDTYRYHVSQDLAYIIPCDPKIAIQDADSLFVPAVVPTPSQLALYGYVSQTCPLGLEDYTPSRLQIGGFALARAGDPVFLYQDLNAAGPRISQIPPLDALYILAGPECTVQDGNVWWQVEWNGVVGWTLESRFGGYYFLEPITAQELGVTVPPTPTPTATLTPSLTPTFTFTPTFTNTPTATLTPSDTPTATLTPSDTPTATLTPSDTPTPTVTFTPTPKVIVPTEGEVIRLDSLDDLSLLGQVPIPAQDVILQAGVFWLATPDGLQALQAQYLDPATPPIPFDDPLQSLAISPDGRWLALGGADGLLMTADLDADNAEDTLQTREAVGGDVGALHFGAAGQLLSTITDGQQPLLKLWNPDPATWQTPQGLLMIIPQADLLPWAAFSLDGEALASYDAETVYIFEVASGDTIWAQAAPREADCGGVQFLPNAETLILAYADCNSLNLMDISAESVLPLLTSEERIVGLAVHPAANVLALATPDGVQLVDTAAWEVVRTLEGTAEGVRFSADGRVLMVLAPDGVALWGLD